MPLLLLGLNHRTAPIDVRERLAISSSRLPETLPRLKTELSLQELVVLSTCNRLEVYGLTDQPKSTLPALTRWFQSQGPTPSLESHLYLHEDEKAIGHLFRVAAGLDSMVVGEQEILGQVKEAYKAAHASGTTGKLMNVLFQRSLYVGKRVRTETGLSSGAASVGSVAVAMAERIFGHLGESRVMILGAGKMAELTAKHLLSQKVHSILVSNRTYAHACELAQQFGGEAIRFEEGLQRMEQADIVICSTASPHPIILANHVNDIMQRRKGRSLFFIDIAVPRNVHPDVHCIDNVYLYNIDDLQSIVKENIAKRSKEIHQAEMIIEEKTREFAHWLKAFHSGAEHSLKHYQLYQVRSQDGSPSRTRGE